MVTASGMFLDTPHVIHDLTLCASELVNDALLAGSTSMTLALLLDHGIVRLSVLDGGDPDPPRSDSLHRAQLIGLRILDGIADRWGIDPAPDGGGNCGPSSRSVRRACHRRWPKPLPKHRRHRLPGSWRAGPSGRKQISTLGHGASLPITSRHSGSGEKRVIFPALWRPRLW